MSPYSHQKHINIPEPNSKNLAEASQKVLDLAVLPHVVFKVLEISNSAESPAAAIEKAIIVDPGFSTKLLAQANSAQYGLPKKVTSIREAVMYLGLKAVRNLAMSVGTFDLFVGKNDAESLRRRFWWRHSLDTALAAKWIAHSSRAANPDDAYTVGLLHLVGKTIMDRMKPRDHDVIAERVSKDGFSEYVVERHLYGYHHGDLLEKSGERWGFPIELGQGLNYLVAPETPIPLRSIVAISSVIATIATSGGTKKIEDLHDMFPEWALENLHITDGELQIFVDDAVSALTSAQVQIAS